MNSVASSGFKSENSKFEPAHNAQSDPRIEIKGERKNLN
jgi:hypothetical protein